MKNGNFIKKSMKHMIVTTFKIIVIIIILSLTLNLNNIHKLDNSYFTVAIGVDKSKKDTNKIIVSFHIIRPTSTKLVQNINNSFVISIEDDTFENALSKVSNYIEGIPDFEHISSIVFSQDISKSGIGKYVESIASNPIYNSDMNILISKGLAKDYLTSISSLKDVDPLNYYNKFDTMYKIGYSNENISLLSFFKDIYDPISEPKAIFCDISQDDILTDAKEDLSSVSIYEPTQNQKEVIHQKNLGTAIFKGDTLVGILDLDETAYHLMFSSILNSYYLSINEIDDEKNSSTIDDISNSTLNSESDIEIKNTIKIHIEQTQKAGITVNANGEKPYISLVIPIKVKILDYGSYDKNIEDNLLKLKDKIKDKLNANIKNYLNKIQKEYKCDVDNFGKYFKSDFLTSADFSNYGWRKKFSDAKIDYVFSFDFIDY